MLHAQVQQNGPEYIVWQFSSSPLCISSIITLTYRYPPCSRYSRAWCRLTWSGCMTSGLHCHCIFVSSLLTLYLVFLHLRLACTTNPIWQLLATLWISLLWSLPKTRQRNSFIHPFLIIHTCSCIKQIYIHITLTTGCRSTSMQSRRE